MTDVLLFRAAKRRDVRGFGRETDHFFSDLTYRRLHRVLTGIDSSASKGPVTGINFNSPTTIPLQQQVLLFGHGVISPVEQYVITA